MPCERTQHATLLAKVSLLQSVSRSDDKNLTRNSFLCSAFFVSFRTSAGSTSLTCASCRQGIRDEDMVHQVLDQVFHQRCFNCSLCARSLQTGEKFYGGLDGKVVCGRHDQLLDRANFRKDVSSVAATSSSGSRSTSDQVSPMSATTTASSASASSTNTSTGSAAVSPSSPNLAASSKTDSSTAETPSTDTSNSAPSPSGSDEDASSKKEKQSSTKKIPGKRAARAVIKGPILEILKNTFSVNPKPSRQVRERLCQETGLSMRTVLVWFQHRRSKERWMQSCMAKTDATTAFPSTEFNQQWLGAQFQQQGIYNPAAAVSSSFNHGQDMTSMMATTPNTLGFPAAAAAASHQQQHIRSQAQQSANNCFLFGDFTSMQQSFPTPLATAMTARAPATQNSNWLPPATAGLLPSSGMASLGLSVLNSQTNQHLNQSMPSILSSGTGLDSATSLCNSTPNLTNMPSPISRQQQHGGPPPRYPSSSDSGLPEDLLSVAEDLASLQGSQHSLFISSPHPATMNSLDFSSSTALTTLANATSTTLAQSQTSRSEQLSSHLSQTNVMQAAVSSTAANGSTTHLSQLLDGLGPLDTNCFDSFQAGLSI
eukprot:scpid24197/ scgid2700/ LIM/homeobox protein Lhx1; Homeobox protein Lim-1